MLHFFIFEGYCHYSCYLWIISLSHWSPPWHWRGQTCVILSVTGLRKQSVPLPGHKSFLKPPLRPEIIKNQSLSGILSPISFDIKTLHCSQSHYQVSVCLLSVFCLWIFASDPVCELSHANHANRIRQCGAMEYHLIVCCVFILSKHLQVRSDVGVWARRVTEERGGATVQWGPGCRLCLLTKV